MTQENTEVKLENTGQIELPSLDLNKYIGVETKIENVTEHKGVHGYFIKVQSAVIDTIERSEDDDIELRASRIFGLQEDKDGKIGWGEKTKLGVFLKKMNVEHYNDLKEKAIICQVSTSTTDEKDYLTFN